MTTEIILNVASAIHYNDLHLSPIAYDFGFFQLRWYALSYLAMILIGWWYLLKLIAQPGAPMARRHADDFVFFAMLGVIIGGRLGYCTFYNPSIWLTPLEILQIWKGGMSLHGGFLGVIVAIWWFSRKNELNMLRVCDYIACTTPFGMVLVRLANFANGELWGRPTDVPWAVIFPGTGDGIARHPSQLYEATLEGIGIMIVLWFLFWRTDARYKPGRLVGTGLLMYGIIRFGLEFVRQPDTGLENLWWGLTMGQTLSTPMILVGLYLLWASGSRSVNISQSNEVEPAST